MAAMVLTSMIGAGSVASGILFGAIEPPPAPDIHIDSNVSQYTKADETATKNYKIKEYSNSGIGSITDVGDRARGVDVSNWQHGATSPTWEKVAGGGYSFSFIKATEGTWYQNPKSVRDTTAAIEAGMEVGQYHYGKPRKGSDPEAEAEYFYANMNKDAELPPVLDIEDTELGPDESVEWVSKFLVKIEELSGKKPIVYTYPSFWRDKMGNSTKFSEEGYPLWIADYHDGDDPRGLPGGWNEWLFWQNSDSGSVPSISGNTDTNYFNGSQEDLENLLSD